MPLSPGPIPLMEPPLPCVVGNDQEARCDRLQVACHVAD